MLEKEKIDKIAHLAKLEIKEEEMDEVRENLSEILEYVEKIKEVDTKDVDFKLFSPVRNRARKDKVEDTDEKTKEKMRAMGKNKDDYFQVESI